MKGNSDFMNITDALIPYFEGKISWEKAVSDACELFVKTYQSETFICMFCGKIVFPKLTTNEHGIFIERTAFCEDCRV